MSKKNFKDAGIGLFFSDPPDLTQEAGGVKALKINPVFKALIPPLSQEEFSQLEENLLQNGIREAISVWNDTIIDGHNRHEIAQRYNLPYTTMSYDFETENDVILWIIKNQFGRRNLSAYDRSILALRLKPVIAEQAKENQGTRSDISQNSAKSVDTRKELAEIAGVSHDTISKVEKIEQAATPEIKEQLKRGDISIHKAYQGIKRQQDKKEAAADVVQPNQLKDRYSVIYAIPPWQYDTSDVSDRTGNHHPTLSVADIKAIKVPSENNAVLFMWATAPLLKEALEVMAAWGFEYKTCSVWDKKKLGEEFWFKGQHELLLVGVKGTLKAPEKLLMVSSVYRGTWKDQSKKPAYYNELIEKMFPDQKYLEMFSHKPYSDKWTVWSNATPANEEDNGL